MSRSSWTGGVLAAAAIAVGAAVSVNGSGNGAAPAVDGDPAITVYKTPTCGCCGNWVEHLRENGFAVDVVEMRDLMSVKREQGVPPRLVSCHTAVVDGYVIEGHVPADAIRRFLGEPPAGAAGLAVPGMPIGSPGMEGPSPQAYDIIAFGHDGATSIFESVRP